MSVQETFPQTTTSGAGGLITRTLKSSSRLFFRFCHPKRAFSPLAFVESLTSVTSSSLSRRKGVYFVSLYVQVGAKVE